MKTIKLPQHEDDSYYFVLEIEDTLKPVDDKYYKAKRKAFANFDTTKEALEEFFDRSSFVGVERQMDLSGTIYTMSSSHKNNMHFNQMLFDVRANKDSSRRCVVRLADSLDDYLDASVNTSCLNIIHYFKNKVTLFFRASDMTNELLYDLILIKEFFIDPVFDTNPEIHVIASTAQNINNFKELLK